MKSDSRKRTAYLKKSAGMSNKELNLKVNIGADTSDFQKGAKQAKQGLKDFEKVTGNALDSIASKFGVNLGQIRQIESAMRGLGSKLSEAGNAGAKAFGGLLQSITPVAGAIAGLGVAAVVASFKALNDEANAFRKTVAGSSLQLQDTAYIETYKQVLHDYNSATGEAVANAESSFKRFWVTGLADFKTQWINVWKYGTIEGMQKANEQTADAARRAEASAEFAKKIEEVQRKISNNLPTIARIEAEIAKQKQIAYDTTVSTEEREEALAKVRDLINQKYEMQYGWQKAITDKMKETLELAGSTPAQIDATNQQEARTIQLEAQQADELRALNRLQGTLTNAKAAEAAEAERANKAAREAAALLARRQAGRAAMNADIAASPLPELDLSGAKPVIEEKPIVIPVKPEIDLKAIEESIRVTKMLAEDFAVSTGEVLGNLVGDLLTGGDAWGNFANAAISAFGDMAIAVGKIAISTGLASEAIKSSLIALEGWGAVAAGVALVALGSAVKTGMRNVAAGNYSAAAGVASSTPTSYNSDLTTNEITVNVTGTLKADGNQLVTVLQNTNKKNVYTG